MSAGIDCGALFTRVSVEEQIAVNVDGQRHTRSCVAFTEDDALVGDVAAAQGLRNVPNTVWSPTRFFCRDTKIWEGFIASVAGAQVSGDGPSVDAKFEIPARDDAQVPAADVVAKLLESARDDAARHAHCEINEAVFAIPVDASQAVRDGIAAAAKTAGLKVKHFVLAPVAAAMAFGLDLEVSPADPNGNVSTTALVFDIGAYVTTATLLQVRSGLIEVKGFVTVAKGGAHIDGKLAEFATKEFLRKHRGLEPTKKAKAKLLKAAEAAKCILSQGKQTVIDVDSFCDGVDLSVRVTQPRLEEAAAPVINEIMTVFEALLAQEKTSKESIDKVLFVGGGCRMPRVQALVAQIFAGTSAELCKSVAPEEAVAIGASIQAGLDGFSPDKLTLEVPISTAPIEVDGKPVLPAGIPLPIEHALGGQTVKVSATGAVEVVA